MEFLISDLLGYLLLPTFGLLLYHIGYQTGRQLTQDEPDGDTPIIMEHEHGG